MELRRCRSNAPDGQARDIGPVQGNYLHFRMGYLTVSRNYAKALAAKGDDAAKVFALQARIYMPGMRLSCFMLGQKSI